MSEPLYRIWSIQDKRYLYTEMTDIDYYVDLRGQPIYFKYGDFGLLYDCIVQRCTGEQDVNKKYIYEGDIVESYPNVVSSIQAVVNFNTGNFVIEDLQGYEELTFEDALTVIGNNLENPELLLEKEEE